MLNRLPMKRGSIFLNAQVYDIDDDGYLSKADLFGLLKSSLRPVLAKAVPFESRGTNEQVTPNATPHRSTTPTDDQEAKEAEADLPDEGDKTVGNYSSLPWEGS